MEKTIVCYLIKNDKYLMLYRNKKKIDPNKGKWITVGGHIESGETKEEVLKLNMWEGDYLFIEDVFKERMISLDIFYKDGKLLKYKNKPV